jgi:general secretion pathway protein F
MPLFAYKASSPTAALLRGVVVADTPRAARDQLRSQGLSIEHLSPRRQTRTLSLPFRSRHRAESLSFIRELSTLLAVGIPLLESLDISASQHRGVFESIILCLRDRIASGATLADAMRDHPKIFDDLSITLTEVGETSGTLESSLARLADFKERSSTVKNRVATALIYPAIVLCMAILVSILLMTIVVPSLLATLVESGKQLPLPTLIVKSASDFLVGNWLLLLASIITLVVMSTTFLRTAKGERLFHRFQLSLPVIGPMVQKQSIVRLAVVMSTLIRSGVVFLRALEIARQTTGNVILQDALRACESAITAGRDIAPALQATKVFPPVVVQVFSIGQQSGKLEDLLDRLAADYDAQLQQSASRLTAVLEPALILFLVAVVGLIGFATMLPLLEAADAM